MWLIALSRILLTMEVKMLFMIKVLMLISFACLASATTIKAKKFMQIYVEEDSWASNEIASYDSHGRLNG